MTRACLWILGYKLYSLFGSELSKACESLIKQEDEGKFRCKTCQKLFKATSFVEKHIANKHGELVKHLQEVSGLHYSVVCVYRSDFYYRSRTSTTSRLTLITYNPSHTRRSLLAPTTRLLHRKHTVCRDPHIPLGTSVVLRNSHFLHTLHPPSLAPALRRSGTPTPTRIFQCLTLLHGATKQSPRGD